MARKLKMDVAPCGLYCRTCPDYKHYEKGFAETAARLQHLFRQHPLCIDVAKDEGSFLFEEFMKGLAWLVEQKNICNGCTAGPGKACSRLLPGCDPGCPIRKCAREKHIRLCMLCEQFPCEKSSYSQRGLINLMRIKKIGLNAWLDEQEGKDSRKKPR